MNVAVTGATGFVGRHVVAELNRRAMPVTLLVRGSTVVPAELGHHPIVRMGDDASRLFERAGRPDVLMHLAWGGLPNYGSPHHVEQELPPQRAMLESLIEAGLPSLLVAGTCFEYGMATGALGEDAPARPVTPYATAKDALRRSLEELRGRVPFALTWARLFYLHGDGQAAGSLWPLLRSAVERGDATFPMSHGEQLRDYLPVAEAARMLVELALRREDLGIVNVCSGRPVSVRRLVEGWIAENGWTIAPEFGRLPYPAHEPMEFWGDDAKLRRILGGAA